MSDNSYGKRGLSGRRLYIAIAAWLVLVIVGAVCTWYGWFSPSGDGGQQAVEVPTEDVAALTAEAEMVDAPPTPTPTVSAEFPTVQPAEEAFGYGIAIHGSRGGDVDYMMGQVESLGLGWVKQQLRWADVERSPGEMEWGFYDWVVESANERGIRVMLQRGGRAGLEA